ncbi:C40 family peptidase [Rubrivirga sp. IMCC43871]|uniref:C40 family peptidase n=1 Tax=Rubrivirga sp. IMCC43871 TaxID=3391575 RepID=UPI00398FCEE7
MPSSLRRAATLAAAVALTGLASPAQSQARPTAPQVSTQDASETAAPRRRPVPRAQRTTARTQPAPRRAAADTITVPVTPVSSRPEMRAFGAESAALRLARRDRMLRGAAPEWIGIPYRWGGTTRRGIDCSAFVQQFVRQTMAIELPRTTASQRYEGVEVSRADLQSGDLVFFRRRGTRHVGVYLSDGDFVHASSSQGVTISNLDDSSYWNRYYWMSRRIVSEALVGLKAPASARRDSSAVRG